MVSPRREVLINRESLELWVFIPFLQNFDETIWKFDDWSLRFWNLDSCTEKSLIVMKFLTIALEAEVVEIIPKSMKTSVNS